MQTIKMITVLVGLLLLQLVASTITITQVSPLIITKNEPTNISLTFNTDTVDEAKTIALSSVTFGGIVLDPKNCMAISTNLQVSCKLTFTTAEVLTVNYGGTSQGKTIEVEAVILSSISPEITFGSTTEQEFILTFNKSFLPKKVFYLDKTTEAKCELMPNNPFQKSCKMTFLSTQAVGKKIIILDDNTTEETIGISFIVSTVSDLKFTTPLYVSQSFEKQNVILKFTTDATNIKDAVYCGSTNALDCSIESTKLIVTCIGLFNKPGSFPIYFGGIKTTQEIVVMTKITPGTEEDSSTFLKTFSLLLVIIIILL